MPVYVDSNATGANNGTSWTNAWTSIASSSSVAAGETVLVEYRHLQALNTANTTYSWTNSSVTSPVQILSVDKDNADAPRFGATIARSTSTTFTTTFTGWINVWDCQISNNATSGAGLGFGAANTIQSYFNCTITTLFDFSMKVGLGGAVTYTNCTFNVTRLLPSGDIGTPNGNWVRGGIVNATSNASACNLAADQRFVLFEDADFSTCQESGIIVGGYTGNSDKRQAILRRCRMPSWFESYEVPKFTNTNFTLNTIIRYEWTGTDASSATNRQILWPIPGADLRQNWTTNIYRDSGANDGSNPYSWQLDGANLSTPLLRKGRDVYCLPVVRWVAAGAKTITVYFAGPATIDNGEFGWEVFSPSESSTARARYYTTRPNMAVTNATHNTDATSTWVGGAKVANRYQMTHSINPSYAGPLIVRFWIAERKEIYIDPNLYIS